MNWFNPKFDASFHEYAALQLHRHNLVVQGKEQDPDFDKTEDQLTAIWEKLDVAQRESVNGISSDLNWVLRKGMPAPKGRKVEDVAQKEIDELAAAIKAKDWHTVLHYLRLCNPVIPFPRLLHLRAIAYAELGLRDYANLLNEMAMNSDPTNGQFDVELANHSRNHLTERQLIGH